MRNAALVARLVASVLGRIFGAFRL